MLLHNGRTIFSASDLVNFMGCSHATASDVGHLVTPTTFPPDDESAVLLQQKGIEHEIAYLDRLRADGRSIIEIPTRGTIEERADATRRAMRDGPEVIYQGAFLAGRWHGYSDFLLRRDDVASSLGGFAYDVADTKLARSAKTKHVLQLCVYADMLAQEQGVAPPSMHVVLGTGEVATLPTASVLHYYRSARDRFEAFVDGTSVQTQAEPCGHCTFCRWHERCDAGWEVADHLSIVAGMGRSQIAALRALGVDDIGALAALQPGRVQGMQPNTVAKLTAQAGLQHHHRRTGERRVEVLALVEGRGFGRLPLPDEGDMFFDMEGDPLFDGGLEYLFGIVAMDGAEDRFHAFWAHDRNAEKAAFERTMDYITDRIARHPSAHVYHYASYEQNALKKLAMYHATREAEVDDLLRSERLVDLYKVVAEGIRTSEPRYSIKNMEAFYLSGGRQGGVKTAGDSIVIYERWRRLGDAGLLQEIADYNEVDCRSTRLCRDWLLSLRPAGVAWFAGKALAPPDPAKVSARVEADEQTRRLAETLVAGSGDLPWPRLLVDLLEFHRREAKPTWWAMFARQEMDADELGDDAECISGLMPHPTLLPWPEKRSICHPFTFPAQDFKMKVGDKPLRSGTLEPAGEIVSLDEDERVVALKLGATRPPIQPGSALIPAGPVGDAPLRLAVHRYAVDVAGGGDRYPAITAILARSRPRLTGRTAGQAIVPAGLDATAGAVEALRALDGSYLLVQGPPGAGKTYTSSQAIVALLAAGKRIGVASNSHKAINNLLKEVQTMAAAQGLRCCGMKKSSREDQLLAGGGWIEDVVGGTGSGVLPHHQLVAGTAWLFAREELDQSLDYLFIDEAGQVSLANVVAMGVATRNIVLVGDQMQLSQPIKGTHPGGSGQSALEHLLEGQATVPADQGVFLPITRRMHPDLCRFISDAVYEGRLEAEATTARQRVEVDASADPEALAPAGLRFVRVDHAGCTQRSPAEVERLARTYHALLGGSWTDRHGDRHRIGVDDILVVSPYNMQVELLKRTLPDGARVGTVDKFQGQEAPVVLVSMATSSGDDLPRDIEFLYSRNRLNVAISRARCLAVIFASPRLLEVPCSTIKQMELVDGLCWAKQFADAQLTEAVGDADPAVLQ